MRILRHIFIFLVKSINPLFKTTGPLEWKKSIRTKAVQEEKLVADIRSLQLRVLVTLNSKLKSPNSFLENHWILRFGGQKDNINLNFEEKRRRIAQKTTILFKAHKFTLAYYLFLYHIIGYFISYYHNTYLHVGALNLFCKRNILTKNGPAVCRNNSTSVHPLFQI